jgi:S-adenosylmethionine-diacylglycerol 3-amino-3-carboxypropyl transferase
LIYNCCWEDPKLDRELMKINNSSKILVITSAGCNALDYLLDEPAEICAVDVNSKQNALLELKMAILKNCEYDDLFLMFGSGSHPNYENLYLSVRELLSKPAQKFWDKKIKYFDPSGIKKSFYYRGTAGMAAWLFKQCIFKFKKTKREKIYKLFDAQTLDEQRQIYDDVEHEIWGTLLSWIIKHPFTMAMLGVPRSQIKIIVDENPGGLQGYVKSKLRHVLTEVPIHDNYFWRVYLKGGYAGDCCPNYLKEQNMERYRNLLDRINIHTDSVAGVLEKNHGAFTHFVLLDHQDWMASHRPKELAEEWRLILKNSSTGTKILMRSAGLNTDFIPKSIKSSLKFFPEITEALHKRDRVGTYGSVHFAEVI